MILYVRECVVCKNASRRYKFNWRIRELLTAKRWLVGRLSVRSVCLGTLLKIFSHWNVVSFGSSGHRMVTIRIDLRRIVRSGQSFQSPTIPQLQHTVHAIKRGVTCHGDSHCCLHSHFNGVPLASVIWSWRILMIQLVGGAHFWFIHGPFSALSQCLKTFSEFGHQNTIFMVCLFKIRLQSHSYTCNLHPAILTKIELQSNKISKNELRKIDLAKTAWVHDFSQIIFPLEKYSSVMFMRYWCERFCAEQMRGKLFSIYTNLISQQQDSTVDHFELSSHFNCTRANQNPTARNVYLNITWNENGRRSVTNNHFEFCRIIAVLMWFGPDAPMSSLYCDIFTNFFIIMGIGSSPVTPNNM